MIKTIKTLSLAASVAVITSPAFAQQAIGDMSKGIMDRLDGVVDLTFLLSMIGGGVLSVIGLMKLKQLRTTRSKQNTQMVLSVSQLVPH